MVKFVRRKWFVSMLAKACFEDLWVNKVSAALRWAESPFFQLLRLQRLRNLRLARAAVKWKKKLEKVRLEVFQFKKKA